MAAETFKIKLGDDEYEIPLLDDFDMNEWQILWDYAGLAQEDFAPEPDCAEEDIEAAAAEDKAAEGETDDEKTARLVLREKMLRAKDGPLEKARRRRIMTPAFTMARLHIGYRRMHPDATHEEIEAIVGSVKRIQYYEAMLDAVLEEKGDSGPPASTPELEQQSPPDTAIPPEPESGDSLTSSGRPALHRVPTGTSG